MKENIFNILFGRGGIFSLFFFIFVIVILFKTNNFYYRDTGDFDRVISGVMHYDVSRQASDFFKLSIKSDFSDFSYLSSYTFVIYGVTWIVGIFSQIFNLKIFSAVLKVIYIFVLWGIFSSFFKRNLFHFIIFVLVSIPLFSSENIGFFSSYYQEQMVLIFLPLFFLGVLKRGMKGFFISLFAVLMISTAKSQFFYFPLLVILFYFLFFKDRIFVKTILLLIVQLVSLYTAFSSSDAVNLNKYHSEYFGLYQYQKMKQIKINDDVDQECIGIDAWGNKFDIEKGAVYTELGDYCIKKHPDASIKKTLIFFIQNPFEMVSLLLDEGVERQLRVNYFHVYYDYKMVMDDSGFFEDVKEIKDRIFFSKKMVLIIFLILISTLFHKIIGFRFILFLGIFSISQVYISFFGEGYRDLSKHLFAVNFSFDMMLFFVAIMLFSWSVKHVSMRRVNRGLAQAASEGRITAGT